MSTTQSASGLPSSGDLDLVARALYTGSVVFDIGLRTGLASTVAAASVTTLPSAIRRTEARRLEHYVPFADAGDASAVFAPPPPVRIRTEPGRDGVGLDGGIVELLRFDSPYEAFNPQLRKDYARHEANRVARAQHWRHPDGPRPTLVVVHGFGASSAAFNAQFFGLREVFADGWDVLLYTLPFHGSRRNRLLPVNGLELFAHGFSFFSEALIHAIHDLRAFVDHLQSTGVHRVGITGLSLGGYTTALAAAVDDRFDFAVPNAAVTWLPPLMAGWYPAGIAMTFLRLTAGMDADTYTRAIAVTSPLTYAPVLPRERLMIVAGLGDRLAPPEQSELLWEHWDRPELHWFPGSHVLHFGRGPYRAALRRLMDVPAGPA